MPPKRKAIIPLLGGKMVKKVHQHENESVPGLDEDKNIESPKSGKILTDKTNKEKGFMTVTNRYLSSKGAEKKHEIKAAELPNLALNKLIQQQSRINLQSSLKWKTYLFPHFSKPKSLAQPSKQYF